MDPCPEPSIRNLLESDTLRWIFVGGKGGVGKTTCSCSIATQLAKVRERVLIISTDPAHNLSDAFKQKFSHTPTKVIGVDNLFAMEVDPNVNLAQLASTNGGEHDEGENGNDLLGGGDLQAMMAQVLSSAPGIDEYLSYIEVFRLVTDLQYSVIVFDTAPTGHTLRLMAFPETVRNGLTRLVEMKDRFLPIANSIFGMLGQNTGNDMNLNSMGEALESRLPIVEEISRQFKNAEQTTFVCVCIPEFLSMYETERLVQELAKHEVSVRNIIINQLLFPNLVLPGSQTDEDDGYSIPDVEDPCKRCVARHRMQSKYVAQLLELYEAMHVIQLPQLDDEIRGLETFEKFSKYMLEPYRTPQHKNN